MKPFQKPDRPFNPYLTAGLGMNALFLLSRAVQPELYLGHWGHFFLGAWEGLAIVLILLGAILSRPERANALREWKRSHLPFLFH